MAEELEQPVNQGFNYEIPTDLPGEELNARIDLVDATLPARPQAYDIYQNSVGNPVQGSTPKLTADMFNTSAYADALGDKLSKIANNPNDDPAYKLRPYTYSGDYDAANFDRYYGTKAYKTLGFSPYRDNETLYNEKMTFGDQFVRSASQWDNMIWTGFKSGLKTWGDIFTDPIAPDLQSAKEMEKAMAIGNITTGGVGGFIGNTILNGMYGIGIGLEFLAEEAALAAGTVFTGGLLGEATVPAMITRGGMFGEKLANLGKLGAKVAGKTAEYEQSVQKAIKGFETASQFSRNINRTSDGIDGVNSARQFFNKAMTGAFNIINPFDEAFKSIKSTAYASNLAKTVGTTGAFIDDIIQIKTAASEAKLEGGLVQIDATRKLIEQYREEYGKDPEGEDLRKIETLARLEGERATLYNYPAIMTTNKLLFSTILYPLKKVKGNASARTLEEIVTNGKVKATADNIFKKADLSTPGKIKSAAKSLLKPKVYGTYGMNYLKANIGEGVQENVQEAISQGAIEHALAVQKDPGLAAYQGYMGYVMNGLNEQLSSQGAETFASGFLMGAFTQPILSVPSWGMAKGIERLKSKEEREAAKKERDAAIDAEANTLNDLANNDLRYWFSDAAVAAKTGALSNDMITQASVGDIKGARDSKFALEFTHLAAASNSNKFDILMDKLADYKNLSPKEALEAFQRYNIGINTEEEAAAALNQIDGVIDRAKKIKNNFEEVTQKFPNYFSLTNLKPNTPEYTAMALSKYAWQEAQRNLIFAQSAYQDYASRTKAMTDAFSKLAGDIAKTDAQSLQSVMTLPNLQSEIFTLKREISALGELEGQADVKKDKEKKLELLQNFRESIVAAQEKIKDEKITDFLDKQAVYGQAKKDFQKYLSYLAKKNDTILFNTTTDEAFTLLTDNLQMKDEMQGLALSINVLNSPKGFFQLQQRLLEALQGEAGLRKERIDENIRTFLTMKDENEVIQSMARLGLKLPEDFLEEYKAALNEGKELPSPSEYIDPSTGKEITIFSDPERYEQADELWQAFSSWISMNKPVSAETKAAEKKQTEETNKINDEALKFNEDVLSSFDPELANDLKQMYDSALESGEIASDQTLKDYVETNTNALNQIRLKKMELAQKANWAELVSNATSEKELDKIMDQIDKVNARTSDLLTAISKKRDTFKEVEPSAVSPEIEKQLINLGYSKEDISKMSPEEIQDLIEYDNQIAKGTEIQRQSIIADIERRRQEELEANKKLAVQDLKTKVAEKFETLSETRAKLKQEVLDDDTLSAQDKELLTVAIDGLFDISGSNPFIIDDLPGYGSYNIKKFEEYITYNFPDLTRKQITDVLSKHIEHFAVEHKGSLLATLEGPSGLPSNLAELNAAKINAKYDAELAALEGKPVEKETTTTLEWKPGPIPEGNTYNLGAGRTAVYNKERSYWEFRRKDGKVIKDKKTIQKLAKELSDKPGIIAFWWNNLLTKEQQEKVTDDINRYNNFSSRAQGVVDLEYTPEIFLMNELRGVKFKPESLRGQVTDVNMSAWTKEGSRYTIDTIITEDEAASIGLPQEDIPNEILALIEAYPNGIKKGDIDQRIKDLTPDTELEDLKKDFINTYGLDLEKVFFNRLQTIKEPTITGKTAEQLFNELSISEKFKTAVDELKNYNILTGNLTTDFEPLPGQGIEYAYQVTLDDGRKIPVSSEYYFNTDVDPDTYRNNPKVSLVLVDFKGKPAIEVRLLEPGFEDVRLTYARENPLKYTKPLTYNITPTVAEAQALEIQDMLPYLDMTLDEMNKNISKPVLTVAKQKKYDVIYQNTPYFITNISEKTVSLKAIDGTSVTADISEITEIRDGQGILKDATDLATAKINQAIAKAVLTKLDDNISSTDALNKIKSNKC